MAASGEVGGGAKIHVALVMTNGNPNFSGGVPAVVLARARYLVAAGHDVSVVCKGSGDFKGHVEYEGFHVYPRPYSKPREVPFLLLHTFSPGYLKSLGAGLEEAHRRRPIDLVDLQDAPAILGVESFLKTYDVPMVFTVHGSALINPAKRPAIGRKLHIDYERKTSLMAKRVLPVSQYIGTVAREYGVPDERIQVVQNTVPEDLFQIARDRKPHDRSGPLRVLFLARIANEKRLDIALRAVAQLPKDTVRLDVAGSGPLAGEMKRLVEQLGITDRVTFHGHVSERAKVRELIAENDVFTLPTTFEAMSIALLEAMASGLYPVVSDIPPNREVLGSDEYLFTAGDPSAMAERLKLLAAEPAKVYRARPHLLEIAEGYRIETLYPKLMQAYSEACGRPLCGAGESFEAV